MKEKNKNLLGRKNLLNQMISYSIIISNPKLTKKASARIRLWKDSTRAWKVFLRVYGIACLVLLLIFGINFLLADFTLMPSLFDYMIMMFVIVNLVQTNSNYYNVFYENDDLSMYAPLPISMSDVYVSKLIGVGSSAMVFNMGLLPFITSYLHSNHFGGSDELMNWAMSTVAAVVLTMALTMIIIVINSYINKLLVSAPWFIRRKKMVQTITEILLVVTAVFLAVGFIFIQNKANIFSHMPAALGSLMSTRVGAIITISVFAVTALLLWIAMLHGPAANYGKNIELIQVVTSEKKGEDSAKRKIEVGGTLTKQLTKFNLGIVLNPSLLSQIVANGPLMACVIPFSLMFSMPSEVTCGLSGLGSAIVLGTVTGIMCYFNTLSLPAVMFSLEKESFDHVKTLPISRVKYLFVKVALAVGITSPFVIIPMEALLCYRGSSLVMMLWAMVFNLAVSVPLGIIFCVYDAKNIYANWTSVSDLINGARKKRMLIVFAISIPLNIGLLTIAFIGLLSDLTLIYIATVVIFIIWMIALKSVSDFKRLSL